MSTITLTFGVGGGYATLSAAIATVSWPLQYDYRFNQVGDSTEATGVDLTDKNFNQRSFEIYGNKLYTINVPATFMFHYGNASNINNFTIYNCNFKFRASPLSSNFIGAPSGSGLNSFNTDNGKFTFSNNIVDCSVAGTTMAPFGYVGYPQTACVIALWENNTITTVYNYVICNNILLNCGSLFLFYNHTYTNLLYSKIYISNNTMYLFGVDPSYPASGFKSIAANKTPTTNFDNFIIRNNYFNRTNNNTESAYYSKIDTRQYQNHGNIYGFEESISTAFDNYTVVNDTFCIPAAASTLKDNGTSAAQLTIDYGHNRYLNDITFQTSAGPWMVGANGVPLELAPPTNLTGYPGESAVSINLTWQPSTSADGYLIYRTSAGSNVSYFENLNYIANITNAQTSAYTDSDQSLSATTDYYYRIKAYRN